VEGPAGGAAHGTCAGGGTVAVTKPSANQALLVASQCKLQSDDGLVYDGTWRFNIASNDSVNGACGLATCRVTANMDLSAARFGYRTATETPFGHFYQSVVTNGVRTTDVGTPGRLEVIDGQNAIVNASSTGGTIEVAGTIIVRVTAVNRSRTAMLLETPFLNATLTLGSSVTAAIDDNRDGRTDRTRSIPWSSFVD
ncbi:MAG TPA: hypothetical protein VEA40_00700, partial [Ramlibacter sp.]|nr:hypothetical protein [Ramlibacter sp.]